jgi:hypothetical protein
MKSLMSYVRRTGAAPGRTVSWQGQSDNVRRGFRLISATGTRGCPIGVCWTGLLVAAVFASCSVEQPAKKHVLLIGLDGVRVDVLEQADTPVLDSLVESGTMEPDAQTRHPTVSGPGWSSMLTGVWADKHGVLGNDFSSNRYDEYPDFLTRFELVDSTIVTMSVVDWPPLGTDASGGPLVSPMVDLSLTIDGDEIGYRAADSLVTDESARLLSEEDFDAAFVYLGDIDVVGHETSSLSPEYRDAIERADRQVGRIVDAVRSRATFDREDWLILISTDHGRADDGSHGEDTAEQRRVFLIASGAGAQQWEWRRDAGIVDIAAAALQHVLGDIDESWNLDGRAPAGMK